MSEGEIRFRHPLVRSAVYQHASLTERQGAHRALADALDSSEQADRRAWHRASACVGFDEAVASELEDTAERAVRRGGYAGAARALERSAELTPDPSVRMRRLVAAADAAIMSGRTDHGLALLDTAERPDAPVELSGEMSRLRGIAELRQGNPVHAFELLSAGRRPRNATRRTRCGCCCSRLRPAPMPAAWNGWWGSGAGRARSSRWIHWIGSDTGS